jgi:hypothetical protein
MLIAALALAACSVSLPQGASGHIALIPFWDEEQSIQGVQPLDGWAEDTMLVQAALPLDAEEALAELRAQTGLTDLPAPTGTLKGKAFTWDLYSFVGPLKDADVDLAHFQLAVAGTGDGTSGPTYLVVLLSLPEDYQAGPAIYDSVFTHVVYALEPME